MDHRVTVEDLAKGIKVQTGYSHRIIVRTDTLDNTVALDQLRGLAEKRGKRFFVPWMMTVFGADIPASRYAQLHEDLCSGALVHPPIRIKIGGQLDGKLAAYNRERQEIEIHRKLAYPAAQGKEDSSWMLLACLLEEFGHFLDDELREGKGDAKTDEGARFGYSLLNLGWNERASFQFGTYHHKHTDRKLPVAVDWSEFIEHTDRLLGEEAQASDDRDATREYFGAGKLNHEHDPCSWGHRAIEEEVLGKRGRGREEVNQIYFGNWLRDYSQAISPWTTQLFPRESLVTVVHYLSHAEFGNDRKFDVAAQRLGEYRYEEHIDHPHGNAGADPASYVVDADTWLPRYIGGAAAAPASVARYPTAAAYIQRQLRLAIETASDTEARLHLGQALHTLEDFYAHSNFVELSLIKLGHSVFPWTDLRMGPGVPPVVTGSFGTLDTAASILLMLAEHLHQATRCDFYADEPPFMMKAAFTLLGDLLMGLDGLTEGDADLEGHWNTWADRTMETIYDLMRIGALEDDPILGMARRAVAETAGFVHCQISRHTATFGAAILAVLVDRIAQEALGHEAHFPQAGGGLGVLQDLGEEIGHMQTVIAGPRHVPTHTQLAKDHDEHPLHDLAARMACQAVGAVYDAFDAARKGTQPSQGPTGVALAFLVHPFHIDSESALASLPDEAERWAAANPNKISQAGDIAWIEHHQQHWQKAKRKSRDIVGEVVGPDHVDDFIQQVEAAFAEGPDS